MTSADNLCQDNAYSDNGSSQRYEICYLNRGEEDQMEIYGYERSTVRAIVTWTFIILSLGALRLLFHWHVHLMLYSTHRRCPLKYADKVLIVDYYQGHCKTYFVKTVRRISLEKLSPGDVQAIRQDLDLETASKLANETCSVVKIYFNDGSFIDESEIIEINVKKLSYIWREDRQCFLKVAGVEKGLTKAELQNLSGFSLQEELIRLIVYGHNEIVVKVQSLGELIVLEMLNPFYIFQMFSLILWFVELYLYYSFAIIAMTVFGVMSSVLQTRKNQISLQQTVQSHGSVVVCRHLGKSKAESIYQEVHISNLVPGDIFVVPRNGFIVPCDAVLLSGTCIVNESMLTGESVPVTKTALPSHNAFYNEKEDISHTLFCGTHLLQARYYAHENIHAVVLRTGYLTARGSLVRSILYPVPHDFKFDKDINRFVWILGVIAIIGTAYSFYVKLLNGSGMLRTIVDSLDVLTIAVPPALPAAMSVGKYYAQNRLQKQNISCINASVINVSGTIDCVCFDKTGTLTEEGLDMYGVIPAKNRFFGDVLTSFENDSDLVYLEEAMASCHSLTLLNNEITGDPLDVKMFEFTDWVLDETELSDTVKFDILSPTVVKSKSGDNEIGIIHQFQFSSDLQRMSVVTRHLNSHCFTIYCKGSPEMIRSLSRQDTIPKNLDAVLEQHTEKGYRVLAIGYRSFPVMDIIKLKRLHRKDVECDLIFSGLIIFENKLKPQTTLITNVLKNAQMKIVMLTGDNIQTAVCVAKECNMIESTEKVVILKTEKNELFPIPKLYYTLSGYEPPKFKINTAWSIADVELGSVTSNSYVYALTGQTWEAIREHYPTLIPKVIKNGVVFARMSSDQKQQVILELQNLNFCVAMCGDGANDCSALRTAHVGISLSEAESSVASPFTSHQPDISCVPSVIREGRAALVTSFGLFKFMVLYSLIEFFSTVLLYTYDTSLSDFEFLYIDIFLIVVFAFFFGQTKPYDGPLVKEAPLSSLLSIIPILSMILQLVLAISIQLIAEILVKQYPWYSSHHRLQRDDFECYDNYAVFTVSQFQYIVLAITFSFGKPYREPIWKNIRLFLSIILMTGICIYITVIPSAFVRNLFKLKLPPTNNFRFVILWLALVNLVISLFFESFIINSILRRIVTYKERSRVETMRLRSAESSRHLSDMNVKTYGSITIHTIS